ncbi:hypothetical protein D3C75_1025130 [compost metagenome]
MVCSARALKPMMAFMGVRISWLMLARKSLLAWASKAAWRDSSLSFWLRRHRVAATSEKQSSAPPSTIR